MSRSRWPCISIFVGTPIVMFAFSYSVFAYLLGSGAPLSVGNTKLSLVIGISSSFFLAPVLNALFYQTHRWSVVLTAGVIGCSAVIAFAPRLRQPRVDVVRDLCFLYPAPH